MILLKPTNAESVYHKLRGYSDEAGEDYGDLEELNPGDISGITCDSPSIPLPPPLEKCYILLASDGFIYSGEIGILTNKTKPEFKKLRRFNQDNLTRYFEYLKRDIPIDLGDRIEAVESGVYFYGYGFEQPSFMLCYDLDEGVVLLTFGQAGTRRRELTTPVDFKNSFDAFCSIANLVINHFYENPYEHKIELPVYF